MCGGNCRPAASGELDFVHHLPEAVGIRSFPRLQMVDVHKRLVEPYAELADLWYNPIVTPENFLKEDLDA